MLNRIDLLRPFELLLFFILSLFLPSKDNRANIAKLLLISGLLGVLFLFCAGYVLPGGANHYSDWALALGTGETLPPGHAQRQIMMALAFYLTGFPESKSYVGITVLFATIGIFIPIVTYACVSKTSKSMAFLSSLGLCISLAPFTYIKFFYPDQLYIFFLLVSASAGVLYMWSKNAAFIYILTVAGIGLALTRTSGLLLLFICLAFLLFFHKKHAKHIAVSIVIFSLAFTANKLHRQQIFDEASLNQQGYSTTGKGMQILYATYLWMNDFGYKLSPEIGPNTALLLKNIQKNIGSNPRNSELVLSNLSAAPKLFHEQNFLNYTSDELLGKVMTEPNEEFYYSLILPMNKNGSWGGHIDDDWMFEIAKEIWVAYPAYVIKYGLRNFLKMSIDPGWLTPRYSTLGWSRQGLQFVPGEHAWKTHSSDATFVESLYGNRAARELEFHQIKSFPEGVSTLFRNLGAWHMRHFRLYVSATSIVVLFGVIISVFWCYNRITRKENIEFFLQKKVTLTCLSILFLSLVLAYENAIVALFVQPHFRYFHLTEPIRWLLVGFSLSLCAMAASKIMVQKNISVPYLNFITSIAKKSKWYLEKNIDLVDKPLNFNPAISVVAALFFICFSLLYWSQSLAQKTSGVSAIQVNSAFLEGGTTHTTSVNITNQVKGQICKYYECLVDLSKISELKFAGPEPNVLISFRCAGDKNARLSLFPIDMRDLTFRMSCYSS